MSTFQFTAVLLDISNELSHEDLSKMKFLCRDLIGKRDMETIDSGRTLFRILSERCKLGEDDTAYLSQLLSEINRTDLSDKLNQWQRRVSTDNQPDQRERDRLDIATEIIAETLGKNWRKLGRKLGLTEVQLESISARHPTELEDVAVEMLKEWRKRRGATAQTEDLINALRACMLNLTADNVEDRLAGLES